jgi:pimeloyl-ACP methyl ester carboxylesterase
MAARFWEWVLGCEFALGILIAVVMAAAFPLPSAATMLIAPAAFLAISCTLVLSSFLFSRIADRAPRGPVSGARHALRALITELVSFDIAKFAMAAPSHRHPPGIDLPRPGQSARPVLLIHGFACNRAVWRPWLERLQAAGFAPIRAIDLEPLFGDIQTYANSVVQELLTMQRQNGNVRIAIIAHSMGGLVARAALRSVGAAVISRIITVGTPHHGTAIAWFFPSRATQQMRLNTPFIQALNAAQEGQLSVPVVSVYSLDDNFIVPARSAALTGARLHELRGLGHLGLLSSQRSIQCAVSALTDG